MALYHDIIHRLSEVYPQGEATALARMLFEVRFNLSLTDVLLGKDNELSSNERDELENIVVRMLKNEPIQYILGVTEFCGMTLKVARGVLIPRPETAELVDWIVKDACSHPLRALDVGTGSGCIALALAQSGFDVEAWDVSDEALAIARQNANSLGLNVDFVREDVLQYDGLSSPSHLLFGVIVSNPPYICQKEACEMERNVLEYEPHLALFVPDEDPLLFYRAIADVASQRLVPGGGLYFELNRVYANETLYMLESKGFVELEIRKDQFGNDRMLKAVKK